MKRSYEEVNSGVVLDVMDVVEGRQTTYTLVCKTNVEMLIVERHDLQPLFAFDTRTGREMLKRIPMLSTYPWDDLLSQGEELTWRYFAKGEKIVDSVKDSAHIYLIVSGFCLCNKRKTRALSLPNISKRKSPRSYNVRFAASAPIVRNVS